MYAIVEIAGKQFRVEKDMNLKVPLMNKKVGDTVEFDKVLLVGDGEDTKIGTPVLDGASVSATVVDHGRDKKIIIFKKKRRKGYRTFNGHRQQFTNIKIDNVTV